MISTTKVVSQEEFDDWLTNLEATGNIPDHPGLKVLKANACLACHSLEGTKLVGPAFNNASGSEKIIIDENNNEKTITVDADYIKNSIYKPNSEVVKGFGKGLMQSYENIVSEEEIAQIVEYFESISEKE